MRVLFVEDDAMNRRVVRDMLSVAGLPMDEAPEAETGLRMVAEGAYDLVLMDLRMPGMDGLTAIRHIRAMADDRAATPIIVVTADTGVDIAQNCRAAGADDIILKPLAMDRLFDAIGRLMASRSDSAAMLA